MGMTGDYSSGTCSWCKHRFTRIRKDDTANDALVCLTATCLMRTILALVPSWRIAP